jgi:hypothetical protein
MGCGFHHNDPEDRVLIAVQEVDGEPLNFSFHRIDSLLISQ